MGRKTIDRTGREGFLPENWHSIFLEGVVLVLAVLIICWGFSFREIRSSFICFFLYGVFVWHLGVWGEIFDAFKAKRDMVEQVRRGWGLAVARFKKKALWLSLVGGIPSPAFMGGIILNETLKENPQFPGNFDFMQILAFLFMWLIGAVITAFYGIPVLFIIDRYFARFTLRYVIGGPVAGYFAWAGISGPLFYPKLWIEPAQWTSQSNRDSAVFCVFLGILVGIVFTVLVRLDERRQRRLAIETTL